jgi:acetyltransferase-like isoleucine patch superfamily enzyme
MVKIYKKIKRWLYSIFLICINPIIPILGTRHTQSEVTLRGWFIQKIIGINRKAYWPVHFSSVVAGVENILIGVDAAAGISPGCYIQGGGKIYIGDYTQIGPNVGIISANHDPYDNAKYVRGQVNIGSYCWIGMNSVVLPGVTLGDFTIVGAGSIVTKSFPDGYCVIAGNPARLLRRLDPVICVRYKNKSEYVGYIKKNAFDMFRRKKLRI